MTRAVDGIPYAYLHLSLFLVRCLLGSLSIVWLWLSLCKCLRESLLISLLSCFILTYIGVLCISCVWLVIKWAWCRNSNTWEVTSFLSSWYLSLRGISHFQCRRGCPSLDQFRTCHLVMRRPLLLRFTRMFSLKHFIGLPFKFTPELIFCMLRIRIQIRSSLLLLRLIVGLRCIVTVVTVRSSCVSGCLPRSGFSLLHWTISFEKILHWFTCYRLIVAFGNWPHES